jgi:hypothetical protein
MTNKKLDVYVGRRAVRGILLRPRLTVQRVGPWLSFEAEWGTRTVHVSVRRGATGERNGNEREHHGDPRGPS